MLSRMSIRDKLFLIVGSLTVAGREIRRVADQTAVATLDVDRMVKERRGDAGSPVPPG